MQSEGERAAAPHAPGPRELAGRYRLGALIGRGGMGSVFAGEQLALGRPCALKLLERRLCEHPIARQRFAREARRAGRIVHENVVAVTDYDEHDGVPFLVMELLHGETLRSLLRREGALTLPRALDITRQICRGLAAAHQLGTVHRDLTPNNVYLTNRADGRALIKLLDFGIAKASDEPDDLTEDGILLGSLRYMAPEQVREPSAVGVRADLYAVGLVLYEMLAGRPAFVAQDLDAAVQQALYPRPRPLHEVCPQLPDAVLRLVERATAPEPEQRFASSEGLLEALRACDVGQHDLLVSAEAVTKSSSDAGTRLAPGAGQRRTLGSGRRRARPAFMAALLLVVASGVLGLLARGTSPEEAIRAPVVDRAPVAPSNALVAPPVVASGAPAAVASAAPAAADPAWALPPRALVPTLVAAPSDLAASTSAAPAASTTSAPAVTATLTRVTASRRAARGAGVLPAAPALSASAPRDGASVAPLAFDLDNPY